MSSPPLLLPLASRAAPGTNVGFPGVDFKAFLGLGGFLTMFRRALGGFGVGLRGLGCVWVILKWLRAFSLRIFLPIVSIVVPLWGYLIGSLLQYLVKPKKGTTMETIGRF